MTLLRITAWRALVLAWVLALLGCGREALERWARTGRVVDGPAYHLGLRPAVSYPDGVALTLQVSR